MYQISSFARSTAATVAQTHLSATWVSALEITPSLTNIFLSIFQLIFFSVTTKKFMVSWCTAAHKSHRLKVLCVTSLDSSQQTLLTVLAPNYVPPPIPPKKTALNARDLEPYLIHHSSWPTWAITSNTSWWSHLFYFKILSRYRRTNRSTIRTMTDLNLKE